MSIMALEIGDFLQLRCEMSFLCLQDTFICWCSSVGGSKQGNKILSGSCFM